MNRKTEAARLLCRLLELQPDDLEALKLLESLSAAVEVHSCDTNRAAVSTEVLGNRFGVGLFSFLDHVSEATLLEGNRDQLEMRQVAINGSSEPSLYLHPPAQLRFEIPTARSGRFACAIAMQPEVWNKPHAGGCEFTLLLDGREVFRKAINPTLVPADRRWHEVLLDLPARSSGSHEFIFRTQAIGTPAYSRWAVWRRPVFHWSLLPAPVPDAPHRGGRHSSAETPVLHQPRHGWQEEPNLETALSQARTS
jgi:hypothetical protein